MKIPPLPRRGLEGAAIVAGLLLITFLAGCATVSTVTSIAASAPASSSGHVDEVVIGERSGTVDIGTSEGLFTVDRADATVRVIRDRGSRWTSGVVFETRGMAARSALDKKIHARTNDGLKVSHDCEVWN